MLVRITAPKNPKSRGSRVSGVSLRDKLSYAIQSTSLETRANLKARVKGVDLRVWFGDSASREQQ